MRPPHNPGWMPNWGPLPHGSGPLGSHLNPDKNALLEEAGFGQPARFLTSFLYGGWVAAKPLA